MAFSLSPSVDIVEHDLSLTIPNLPSAKTGMVIKAQTGPALVITSVTSESDLTKFGTPTNDNYQDWYNAWNFLQYASSLYVVRPIDNAKVTKNAGLGLTPSLDVDFPKAKSAPLAEGDLYNADQAEIALGSMVIAGTRLAFFNKYVSDTQPYAVAVCSDEATWDDTATADVFGAGAIPTGGAIMSHSTSAVTDTPLAGENVLDSNKLFCVAGSSNMRIGDTFVNATIEHTITALGYAVGGITYTISPVLTADITTGTVISADPVLPALGSTAMASNGQIVKFREIFEYKPDFDNLEFAVVVLELNSSTNKYEIMDNEKFVVSWNPLGRDTFGRNIHVDQVFANSSKVLYAKQMNSISLTNDVSTDKNVLADLKIQHFSTDNVGTGITTLYPGTITGGVVSPFTGTFVGGSITAGTYDQGDVDQAMELFANAEDFDVNILISHELSMGKASVVAENRMDAFALVAPYDYDSYVGLSSTEATAEILTNFTPGVGTVFSGSNTYTGIFGNMKYQYDKFNDVNRWMCLAGDVAGLMAQTDRNRDPWWAAAGLERGKIKNAIKLAFNPNKNNRDDLYVAAINPIISVTGEGVAIVYGQKTATARPSAFNRINVRRLLITLEKAIATSTRYALFEFNDEFTRARIVGMIDPFMRDVKGRRGVYDFLVVCDESNNTGEVIDRNELIVDVYLKPTRVAEFIRVNMKVTRTDADFTELVGLAA